MFDQLPSETVALRTLLADLHDDLDGRVDRLRFLMALEFDFGEGRCLLIPGGFPAYFSYVETRQAFVNGSFLSVVLLSQCILENLLAAHVGMEALSAEIQRRPPPKVKSRPKFHETVKTCEGIGLLTEKEGQDLLRLSDIRNALAHFRTVDDPSHLDRRAIRDRRTAAEICEEDARFAIGIFVRILAKPVFRFAPDPPPSEG